MKKQIIYLTIVLVGLHTSAIHSMNNPSNLLEKEVFPTSKLTNNKSKKEASNIVLYPNPPIDYVYVQYTGTASTIQLFNIEGQLLHSCSVQGDCTKISVIDLRPGLYIIRVGSDSKMFSITR